ncbi:unnamed protein product, partial [Prorocentrum cordatum]
REVNRRLQAMLVQQGADPVASQWDWATERGPASARADPMAATWPAKVRSSVSVGFLPEPPGTAPVSMRRSSAAFSDSSDLASEDGLHFSRSPSGPGRPASREGAVTARSSLAPRASAMALRPRRSSLTAAVRHRATLGGEQQVSRLSRMLSCFGFFWRDLEAPSAILQALADVVFRTATDRHMVVTVFVVDPWLRSSLDEEGQGDRQMPVFYLGQGKVELTAIPQSSSGKAEAPRFADLSALPYRSRAALAAPVPRAGASAGRPLAVVQISGDRDFERQLSVRRRSSRTPPPVEQRDSNSSHVGNQQSISSHISHRSSIHDAPGGGPLVPVRPGGAWRLLRSPRGVAGTGLQRRRGPPRAGRPAAPALGDVLEDEGLPGDGGQPQQGEEHPRLRAADEAPVRFLLRRGLRSPPLLRRGQPEAIQLLAATEVEGAEAAVHGQGDRRPLRENAPVPACRRHGQASVPRARRRWTPPGRQDDQLAGVHALWAARDGLRPEQSGWPAVPRCRADHGPQSAEPPEPRGEVREAQGCRRLQQRGGRRLPAAAPHLCAGPSARARNGERAA